MRRKRWKRDKAREPVHFNKKTFDEWPLEDGDTMRVSIEYFKGHDFVHVRRLKRGLYHTKKGAAIDIDKLPRLLRALKGVRTHAREIGLLPPASRSR
jgi:hypothetical protein